MSSPTDPLRAGVIGTGTMGRHHARVYHELPGVALAGVTDVDEARAREVANRYGTAAMPRDPLLDAVDLVTVAVPTAHHYPVASSAIDRGVHLLVEKPFVDVPDRGRELVDRARSAGLTLQVGHIERFNPAVVTLADVLPDLELIAVDIERLGPPLDRRIDDDVILDLMIHDVDLLLSIVDTEPTAVHASTTAAGQYATATVEFETGVIGTLTASRVTQQKVRGMSVTAKECRVNVDFSEQSVQLHRHSSPAYLEDDGDVRYRYESVIERPSVDHGEPLRAELESFVEAVRTGRPPAVDGEAGVRAVSFAERLRREAAFDRQSIGEVQPR